MTHRDLLRLRLHNQRLSSTRFTRPEDVVHWLGAVQAQDYPGAKWAVGQRMQRATDEGVERACADGRILRTHVMRPTWHFVVAGDIRWLLALTAPRVLAANRSIDRMLGLNDADFRRSRKVLERVLRDDVQLTRDELRSALRTSGIKADGSLPMAYYMMRAELDGVICSGARKGRQFTYALLDERVPPAAPWSRDEALAELTRRYFSSHGPAQLKDFAWWSGLTMADARKGVDILGRHVAQAVVDGTTYWHVPAAPAPARTAPPAHLLPLYDEYLIAYKDRSAAFDRARPGRTPGATAYDPPMVSGGRVVGNWKRTLTKETVTVALRPDAALPIVEKQALRRAARRFAGFLGVGLILDQ